MNYVYHFIKNAVKNQKIDMQKDTKTDIQIVTNLFFTLADINYFNYILILQNYMIEQIILPI